MEQPRTLQSGEIHKRGREIRKTGIFHTVQRRQTVLHGLQTGAAHIRVHDQHVVEQVHSAARRGRVVRGAEGEPGPAVRHFSFPSQTQE